MNFRTFSITALSLCVGLTIGCGNKTNQPSATNAEGNASTAPSGQQAAAQKTALVRFVNAIPGKAVDLWFGETKPFTDVSFKTVTPYQQLPGKRADFKLTPTGESTAANSKITNSEGLTNGEHYTVVAAADATGKQMLKVINDKLTPSTNKAQIRVINASPEEVDVYAPAAVETSAAGTAERTKRPTANAEQEKWFSGVDADSATSYKSVDAMNASVQVRPGGGKSPRHSAGPVARVPVALENGKLYTLVVTAANHGHALNVMKVEDQLMPATTPAQ